MKLGIMQPYFLPYLGYYSLIRHTDKWIVFDTVQYIRHGWIERNRVLKPGEGWQYISVPLNKHDRNTLIKDISIRDEDWRTRILRQLDHYKKAPYYKEAINVIAGCFDIETNSITALNTHALKCTCAYLDIDFNYEIHSQMDLPIEPVQDAGEWALHISKAYGAGVYINPAAGSGLFNRNKFNAAGIELKFLKIAMPPYEQRRKAFEPGLSMVDIMMFNSAGEINDMINKNTIISNE